MSLNLAPDVQELILSRVSGPYRSADDVVREAMRLLDERDREKLESLRKDIRVALDEVERGEELDGPAAFAEIRRDVLGHP